MKKGVITPQIENFLDIVERESKKKEKIPQTIFKLETSELAGQMALWYEKVRTAVQYKEEHLLRRSATQRILKRLITIEQRKKEREITYALFLELALAGYVQQTDANDNNFLQTEEVIARYLKAFRYINHSASSPADSFETKRWMLNLASEEIENIINPQKEKMALVFAIYETLRPKIKFNLESPPYPLPGSRIKAIHNIAEEYLGVGSLVEPIADTLTGVKKKIFNSKTREAQKEKILNMLTYLAIFRSLRKSDLVMLRSLVFNIYYPKWTELTSEDEKDIFSITKNFILRRKELEIMAEHPLVPRILFAFKKHMLCASFFFEAVIEKPHEALATTTQNFILHQEVKEKCAIRYMKEKNKLRKRIGRGILYVFLTKMMLAVFIEVPYELLRENSSINYLALLINLGFPPLLLATIASSARYPREDNTNEIIKGIDNLVYVKQQEEELKEIKITDKENAFAESILDLFYIAVLIFVLTTIVKLLNYLQFNIVATVIFLIFTGTVSFFGALIRQSIRDLVITKDREGLISLIFDTILLPFVRMGRLLSVKFSKINVLIFILDFLVEAPFKFIIRVFEAWFNFLRRKRDEIERQFD